MVRRRLFSVAVPLLFAAAALAGQAADNSLEATLKRLGSAKMDVTLEKQGPEAVFDLVRDAARVNIVVTPEAQRALAGKTITLKLKGVSALSVLSHALRQLGLVSTYADEALVVTTEEAARPHPQITVYDIRDITLSAPGSRLPPQLFGSQVDPLYYYWLRTRFQGLDQLAPAEDPFAELQYLDTYPPDRIGEIIARAIQERLKGTGVSVTYQDGYLVVVEQPRVPRVPPLPPRPKK